MKRFLKPTIPFVVAFVAGYYCYIFLCELFMVTDATSMGAKLIAIVVGLLTLQYVAGKIDETSD